MTDTTLTLAGIGKTFGDAAAVSDVDLDIPAGSFVVLLGPSGCGKTTTLRMLAGLENPTTGSIRFGERTVADGDAGTFMPPGRRGAGLVFQSYALWPHMSVRANVEWPLQVAKWSKADRAARVDEVLALLEISDLADRSPSSISGGQQQRVAIARTIAPRPPVLLFDEPLSNLDARLRVEMRAELVRVHRATGATSVYVTHDQIEALAMATHVAVMNNGRVEQFDTPEALVEHPRTAFVASFVGTPPAVLLECTVRAGSLDRDGFVVGPAPASAAEGSPVTAMYRPDSIRVAAPGASGIPFEVVESTPLAGRHLVSGVSGRQTLAIVLEERMTAGERVTLELPSAPVALFDGSGARVERVGA
ncbi:ABC transporter ATP-binding protein [Marisediminicola sp. LYQ134]|uniref:ABC transporter ATP-binding protein n=1 Tax=Marisediminicola sp. LYQ134 TaxID=3391061 RepID=UPI0039834F1D